MDPTTTYGLDQFYLNESFPVKSPRRQRQEPLPAYSWLLGGFLAAALLLGGGARADVFSLLLLRPLAALALAAGLILSTREQWRQVRVPAYFLGAMALLVLIELIPLPPAIWTSLPGREIAVNSFKVLGIEPNWQPWTMDAFNGWNALFSLTVPAAVVALMVAVGRAANRLIIYVLLGFLTLTTGVAMLQLVSGSSALYFYRITNEGMPVGLFANRNHQALFLAMGIPLIAHAVADVTGSVQKVRAFRLVAGAAVLLLLTLIGVTGSRAGVASLLVALPAAVYLFTGVGKREGDMPAQRRLGVWMAAVAAAVAMGAITFLSGRNLAVDRLLGQDAAQDLRFQALPTLWSMVSEYFPFGSGAGSFVSVYKIAEPDKLLSASYFNHAHNDLIEVLIEHGLVGGVLIVVVMLFTLFAAFRTFMTSNQMAGRRYGILGVALLVMVGFGSLLDYPLRTPAHAALAAIAAVWMAWSTSRNPVQVVD